MHGLVASQLRTWRRLASLSAVVAAGLARHRRLDSTSGREQCAQWLHETCMRGAEAIDLQMSVIGRLPANGLIVSNHLSYLDILTFSAALPCVFVSKAEVEQWPVFGRYARWSGTVFVRRHDRTDASRANVSVGATLREGIPVVLFPEGTTTDGSHILRFHSTMLQPAIDVGAVITPAAIRYELEDGDPATEVAWWGDMTLLPHLWNVLGKRFVRARIVFGEPIKAAGDRKQLSAILHECVLALLSQQPSLAPQ